VLHLDIALHCAETSTLQEENEKHLESFEMLCCRGMEKIRHIMWEVRMCYKKSRWRGVSYK